MYASIVGVPLPCTFVEARQKLLNYRSGNDAITDIIVRKLANFVDTTLCPWCNATGIAWSIQQLTPEEAAAIRAEESG